MCASIDTTESAKVLQRLERYNERHNLLRHLQNVLQGMESIIC